MKYIIKAIKKPYDATFLAEGDKIWQCVPKHSDVEIRQKYGYRMFDLLWIISQQRKNIRHREKNKRA